MNRDHAVLEWRNLRNAQSLDTDVNNACARLCNHAQTLLTFVN